MSQLMLRTAALSLLLLSCLVPGQGTVKQQSKDKTKGLDAAAATPFFTKKGADSVKRVVTGADERKEDEKVLDSTPAKQTPQNGAPAGQTPQAQPGQPNQPPQPQPQPPVQEPVFAWRLIGISYGKKKGMALFQAGAQNVTVRNGETLDPETKIVSVTKSSVVLVFHGKRLELTPW